MWGIRSYVSFKGSTNSIWWVFLSEPSLSLRLFSIIFPVVWFSQNVTEDEETNPARNSPQNFARFLCFHVAHPRKKEAWNLDVISEPGGAYLKRWKFRILEIRSTHQTGGRVEMRALITSQYLQLFLHHRTKLMMKTDRGRQNIYKSGAILTPGLHITGEVMLSICVFECNFHL